MGTDSLKNKTINGVGWSALDNVVSYIVSFVVGIVLARLLSPDDYGLLGIIAIFTTVCNALINGGFVTALIRKNNASDEDYNTAFLVNLLMSLCLYIVIFISSPFIALFFERKELVLLTRVSSVTMIIGAVSLVQQARLTKRIDFKTQTKITFIASISSGIVGITMAFMNLGVWALVTQSLVSQSLKSILLFFYNKWLPSFSFSKNSFKNLFGFGWKMMVSSILDSVWNELYQVIIGKFYKPATLGQYTRAKGFSQLFSSNLTSVIQRVTYPVISSIQDNNERMISAYRKIIKITMFITFICMFVLGAISEPLIYCLIGEKWHEAATYLPFICFIGAFYPLHAINLNMLKVQGRSDLFLILEIIKKIIALGPLFIGAFVGIFPMLYASILTNFIAYFLNSYYTGKKLHYSSFMQLKDVYSSFLIAIVTAGCVYCLKYICLSYWLILPIQIVFGIALVITICHVTKNNEYFEIKEIVLQELGKTKRR